MPNAQQALLAAERIGVNDRIDNDAAATVYAYLREQADREAGRERSEQASSERFGAAMNASELGWPRTGSISGTGRIGSGDTPSYIPPATTITRKQPATDTPDLVLVPPIETDAETRDWCVRYDLSLGQDVFPGVVKFQSGPVREEGVNGTSMEALLRIVLDRLQGYQRGPFPCPENAIAAKHIGEALEQLDLRTLRRRRQGVEGQSVAHASA